jgi:sec-independent protein translocase protein TatA
MVAWRGIKGDKAMFGLGIGEMLVILVVVLLLFGPSRISKVMGDLGKGVNAFKQGLGGVDAQTDGPKDPADPSKKL